MAADDCAVEFLGNDPIAPKLGVDFRNKKFARAANLLSLRLDFCARHAVTQDYAPRRCLHTATRIQTCLTMKLLFGMALRQTAGFGESLLRLIGLDWAGPDFSTVARRQKTLKVNSPYRGSEGPRHLLLALTRITVEGEGDWTEQDQQPVRGAFCPMMAQAWRRQT